ncbi:CBM96 family carbohydrate-binding protein [Flavobacterium sp. WC2509]|uniref:CBM96 family carbohydrate-binding protein n=1 Tax=Flavobacterium sp. WC2509 TaxID=3461406 RepID=UPI004043B4C0
MRKNLFLMAFCFASFTIVQAKTVSVVLNASDDKLNPEVKGKSQQAVLSKKRAAVSSVNSGMTASTVVFKENNPVATVAQLAPVADCYVTDGASADMNFGSNAALVLKKSSPGFDREIYMKFDLDGTDAFNKAVLRLYISFAGPAITTTTWQVYAVPMDAWTEKAITSKNKPASGTLLATINGQGTKTWAEWDITSQALAELSGNKRLSLRIVSTNATGAVDVTFVSKEGEAALRPQLVLSK